MVLRFNRNTFGGSRFLFFPRFQRADVTVVGAGVHLPPGVAVGVSRTPYDPTNTQTQPGREVNPLPYRHPLFSRLDFAPFFAVLNHQPGPAHIFLHLRGFLIENLPD